jgi:hypothetical protein
MYHDVDTFSCGSSYLNNSRAFLHSFAVLRFEKTSLNVKRTTQIYPSNSYPARGKKWAQRQQSFCAEPCSLKRLGSVFLP